MSINFSQFPLAATPIQSTDVVVGYQVRNSVPTLAQYTVSQFLSSALTFSNEGAGVGVYDAANSTGGNYKFKSLTASSNITITDNGAAGIAFGLTGVPTLAGNNVWTGTNDFTANTTSVATAATATNSTVAASTAYVVNKLASPTPIGSTAPSTGAFTTLSATGNFTPSQTNGIVGTTTNNNANAGSVGEYVSATQSTNVPMTNNTAVNITSISLTAGDWDVSGTVSIVNSGANMNNVAMAISNVSASLGSLGQYLQLQVAALQTIVFPPPTVRFSLSATTTVFLVAQAGFLAGTTNGTGVIRARRVR